MNQQEKQYFYQEGMNMLHYLRQSYPSLHLNRLRFLKGLNGQGAFDFRSRDILISEDHFDEGIKLSSRKEVARQFIMVLCHEAAHASDEHLKYHSTKRNDMSPVYTSAHADIEAFAFYRESRMVKQLSKYRGTIFGYEWTEDELRELARESLDYGFQLARNIQNELEGFQTNFTYRFKQFFLRLFRVRTRHSTDYAKDFYNSFKLFQKVRMISKLDTMRRQLNT